MTDPITQNVQEREEALNAVYAPASARQLAEQQDLLMALLHNSAGMTQPDAKPSVAPATTRKNSLS